MNRSTKIEGSCNIYTFAFKLIYIYAICSCIQSTYSATRVQTPGYLVLAQSGSLIDQETTPVSTPSTVRGPPESP